MKQIAPKCPTHLGRSMVKVGQIVKTGHQGQKHIEGFKYRCTVDFCPACEVVLLPPPEVELTRYGKPKRRKRRRRRVT